MSLIVAPQGDANSDGTVANEDVPDLTDCLAGPDAQPDPSGGITTQTCLEIFDFVVGDNDVDLYDFAQFQLAFDGS